MLFAGQYEVKLERKKRILMPKIFLKSIEKQNFKGFFLFPSLQGSHIEACGEAWLAYWSRKMDEQGSILNKNEVLISNILDHVVACEVDKSGRIMLPSHFTENCELHQNFMITGRGFRFQIWKKDEFLAYRKHMQGRLKEVFDGGAISQEMPAQAVEQESLTASAKTEPPAPRQNNKNRKKGRK